MIPIELDEAQLIQLKAFESILKQENKGVNLVSRASVAEAWDRHILHCLSLGIWSTPSGSAVVDWGTGGGLPAIPLAIIWPDATIIAVDSILKKIRAVERMRDALELSNLQVWRGRAEDWKGPPFDYSVSRATVPLGNLWAWHLQGNGKGNKGQIDCWTPGLLCLKGGDLKDEIKELKLRFSGLSVEQHDLEPIFQNPYFREKYLIHVYPTRN